MELKPQWIIDTINSIEIQKMKLNRLLSNKKQELIENWIYKEIKDIETSIRQLEQQENEAREVWKQIMISNGLKKFEALDGTIIQLNKTPWSLIIENEEYIPEEYIKTKIVRTIDKVSLKKDIQEWFIIEWVSISEDFNLIIKNK